MKNIYLVLVLLFLATIVNAQSDVVSVVQDNSGMRLQVDGKDFIVNGVNWDYVPIGSTITDPGIWNRTDDIIMSALDAEMSLLKNMGVNAIRTYDLAPKWITYIYENYGIYTMLNITFGAYGLTINGAWTPQTDYADPATREVLMAEARVMAETYKDTPGLLLYMIGNENNYHLSWTGAETEDIPIEADEGILIAARALYKAFNDATLEVKKVDRSHPVAICNGDLLYLDLVKQECRDIDIYGTNMYRGISFGDAFQRVKDELNMPILFSEFGADAFNARDNQEDQYSQAYYDVGNWRDIYENAAGLGKANNSIGGFTFQFSDGWWKYKQTENLELHDNTASWSNGGYSRDQAQPSDNNMNEEWFGICAKGPTDFRGLYTLYPRAAYYALKEVHSLNPYGPNVDAEFMSNHFDGIQLMDAVLRARGDKAALAGEGGQKLGLSELRAEISTFNTGGKLITTPDDADPNGNTFPNQLGFDAMESYFVGFEANPSSNVHANVTFNMVGNVALNPINELFYENRARPQQIVTQNGDPLPGTFDRLQLYQAEYSWDHKYFNLKGFYRTGHYHWGYEGDFFGLYPEANYGPNLDIYNGLAPQGLEIEGKDHFKGLKVAYGQELWWGANPAVLVKYTKKVANVDLTGIFHEDIQAPGAAITSIAVPQPRTRRMTVHAKKEMGKLTVEAGGIWGGQPLVDREFQFTRGSEGNYQVFTDQVQNSDTWGGKVKLTYQVGRINWYAQGSSMGLVAFGGGDPTQTFTGWRLKDTGSGNVNSIFTGATYQMGKWQIAPNFMYQKPLVDPMPGDLPENTPGRLRNILDDPFVVRANRETVAGELLLTFDPTPGTWMYAWDNDRNEDASLAASVGIVYRHLPTNMDAAIIFDDAGRTPFGAPGTPPALDLWEVNTRIVSKINPELGIIANLYGGNGQANGDDARTVERYGGDVRVIYKSVKLNSHLKFNDWGPFDYHRDFNLTFPLQIMADLSTTVGKQDWFILPSTTLGIRFMWRSLDENSPRYLPNETEEFATSPIVSPVGFPDGNEWEFRTYVHINLGR